MEAPTRERATLSTAPILLPAPPVNPTGSGAPRP
jgi:hypothetical protein